MSNPANPLAKYRSYSYHHLLIACNSTTAVERLTTSTDLNTLIENRDPQSKYKKHYVGKKQVGDAFVEDDDGAGEYVILINSITDAEFFIDDVNWTTIISPSGSMTATTSVVTEGSIKVLEPAGGRLFKVIQDMFVELRTDGTTTQWLLKTVFVGYPMDINVTEPQIIQDTKPFPFMLTDIKAEHTEVGSVYDFSIVGINNGASKLPYSGRVHELSQTFKYDAPDLLSVFGALQETIKNEYQIFYDKYVKENLKDAGTLNPIPVTYVFGLHPLYQSKEYEINQNSNTLSDTGTNDSASTFAFPPKSHIEGNIQMILNKCTKIKDDGLDGITGSGLTEWDGKRALPKIYSTITVEAPTKENKNGKYEVLFYIAPREIIQSPFDSTTVGEDVDRRNVIEFDYLFTGKNIDILEFNMNIELGLSFYQTLGESSNLPTGQLTKSSNESKGTAKKDLGSDNFVLFPYTRNKNPEVGHDKKEAIKSMKYRDLLARQAGIETAESSVRILGNPCLLNDFIQPPSGLYSSTEAATTTDDTEASCADKWQQTPVLVKINIRYPDENYGKDKSVIDNYWYDDYYYLYAIENTFTKGEFTQNLLMFSQPQESVTTDPVENEQVETDNSTDEV